MSVYGLLTFCKQAVNGRRGTTKRNSTREINQDMVSTPIESPEYLQMLLNSSGTTSQNRLEFPVIDLERIEARRFRLAQLLGFFFGEQSRGNRVVDALRQRVPTHQVDTLRFL